MNNDEILITIDFNSSEEEVRKNANKKLNDYLDNLFLKNGKHSWFTFIKEARMLDIR